MKTRWFFHKNWCHSTMPDSNKTALQKHQSTYPAGKDQKTTCFGNSCSWQLAEDLEDSINRLCRSCANITIGRFPLQSHWRLAGVTAPTPFSFSTHTRVLWAYHWKAKCSGGKVQWQRTEILQKKIAGTSDFWWENFDPTCTDLQKPLYALV